MKKLAVLVLAMTLAACSDKVADARKELEMVKAAHASSTEVCRAERKIETALLEAHYVEQYKMKKIEADLMCAQAAMDAERGR
jgi:hypothetical protein